MARASTAHKQEPANFFLSLRPEKVKEENIQLKKITWTKY